MRIDVIETLFEFERVRENWDRVYRADPHAHYFLSWKWLLSHLSHHSRWFILCLREREPGSAYVAFFPLRIITQQDPKTGLYRDEILMAGNNAADYTGLISEAAYEQHAVNGFPAFLKSQNWTDLKLINFAGPPWRAASIIKAFEAPIFKHRHVPQRTMDQIDNTRCPCIELPSSWDVYLEEKLSSQTRQKLRRFMRKVEHDQNLRITFATAETIERDLDALFVLWRTKWGSRKGERTDQLVSSCRQVLIDAFRDGDLEVPSLWYGDRLLGVLANLIDRQKKAVLFYITGRDETWQTPSPGLILHGICIRRAIEQGFRTYDFLRGNEPYKYSLGGEERRIVCVTIRTTTERNLGDRLHPRSIRYVYEKALKFYASGQKGLAEVAFQQVYSTMSDHVGARFGLAQLLFDRGKLQEAEAEFRKIAEIAADAVPVLIRLGDTLLAQRRFTKAADIFLKVIDASPHRSEAHFKRGVALAAARQVDRAVAAFVQLETIHSDDPTHAVYRRKARDALERIASTAADQNDAAPLIHPKGFPLTGIPTSSPRPRPRRH